MIKQLLILSMPFSALGITFMAVGFAAGDERQFDYGLLWMAIAIIVIVHRAIVHGIHRHQ
jgi:hypothetical protein